MECRVEACHVRQAGKQLGQRLQHGHGGRIMQRREWLQSLDLRERRGVHHHGRIKVRAAMHDTMTKCHEALLLQRPVGYRGQHRERGGVILCVHHAVMRGLAIGGRYQQTALPADLLHLAALQTSQGAVRHAVHGKLQTGRAGIQNAQATILHISWPFTPGACML